MIPGKKDPTGSQIGSGTVMFVSEYKTATVIVITVW